MAAEERRRHGDIGKVGWGELEGGEERKGEEYLEGPGWRRVKPVSTTIKNWMSIHYDTVDDGQNRKSYPLFSILFRIVFFFLYVVDGIYLSKIITTFHLHLLNNKFPYENKCFNPNTQNHRMVSVLGVNSVCVQTCNDHSSWICNYPV